MEGEGKAPEAVNPGAERYALCAQFVTQRILQKGGLPGRGRAEIATETAVRANGGAKDVGQHGERG